MVEFNPYSWSFHEDPYSIYRALREEAPAYYNPDLRFWALSRHADVLEGFRRPMVFSNACGVALEAMSPDAHIVMSMLAIDPPRHDKLRGLVSKVFTPRRVKALEPHIRELTSGLIDDFIERGECDFIEDFAGILPMDVISEMLGFPKADRAEIRRWADLVVHHEEGRAEVRKSVV